MFGAGGINELSWAEDTSVSILRTEAERTRRDLVGELQDEGGGSGVPRGS